jgi:Sodium/hydrogen exchanger family
MGEAELLLLGLMVAVVGLSVLARVIRVPYPILLVLGGLVLGFVAWEAGLRFVAGAVGGVAIGLLVGWLVAEVRRRLDEPPVEIMLSLATGYAAYLPADRLGVSGVLAAVTAGLYVGWRNPEIASAPTRLLGFSFWDVLVFLVNAILFILVGLQLHPILSGISGHSAATLLGPAAAVSAAVIATRIVWEFTVPYLIRLLDRPPTQRARRIGARARLVVGWSGMRGAVSLAAALALPLPTGAGQGFPQHDLIIFAAFAVILVTLVLQGLTLPVLIRRLGVHGDGGEEPGGAAGGVWSRRMRRWRGWRSRPPRTGPATTPWSGSGAPTTSVAGASRRRPARSKTTATRTGRAPGSGWCASSSKPSATPSSSSATRARSATT